MRYFLTFIITVFMSRGAEAQDIELLNSLRDSVKYYSSQMVASTDDKQKVELSDKVQFFVEKLIKQEKSINYSLNTLRLVKVLTSKDKRFRVFTWVIPFNDRTYAYRGFVQAYSKSRKEFYYYNLLDKGDKMHRIMNKSLSPKKWLGAYYYKIIQVKRGRNHYYTLLGWRGIDRTIQSKVIEIAHVKSNGSVVFGYGLFKLDNFEYFKKTGRSAKRLVFKFSTEGSMYLNYDYQTLVVKTIVKKKKRRKKKYRPGFNAQAKIDETDTKVKTFKDNVIVMDRLVPKSPQMKEFYEFYYPESNIIDALRFEKKRWRYYSDIDARNKEEKTKSKARKVEYDLSPK